MHTKADLNDESSGRDAVLHSPRLYSLHSPVNTPLTQMFSG